MLNVKYFRLYLIALVFSLMPNIISAQEKILDLDVIVPSPFPKVRAYYTAGTREYIEGKEVITPFEGLTNGDFTLTETIPGKGTIQVPTTAFTQKCSTLKDAPAVRVILVIDNSFSMAEPAGKDEQFTRMQVVKNGAKAFVNEVDYIPPTGVAVVSFATEAQLRHPFSNNPASLETAIDGIEPAGNTNYDDVFFNNIAGAIALFRSDPYEPPAVRRVLIFLTDGSPSMGDLLDPAKKNPFMLRVKDSLDKYNITMFAITAFMKMNPDLRTWSSQTGGRTFEVLSQNPNEEMEAIYREIANLLSKRKLCWLEWTSMFGCSEESRFRTVEMELPKEKLKSSKQYTAPDSSVASVRVSKTGLSFGNPPPNGTVQQKVTLTAVNSPVTISNPVFAAINCGTYQIISPTPPFTINKGESREVTIEFKQGPAQVYCPSSLTLTGDPCAPTQIALFGGVNTVQLLEPSPTTASVLSSCEDINVVYDGVVPITKPILIEYSSNNGLTWATLSENATGGNYVWPSATLKLLPKDGKFKLRLTEKADDKYLWAKSGGGPSSDSAFTIQIGANDDDLFIAGIFKNSINFGAPNTQLTNSQSTDFGGFVAKYSAISSNAIWATPFTSTKLLKTTAATCNNKKDDNQRIYAVGYFTGVAKIGSQEKQASDNTKLSMFMAVLSPNGSVSNAIHLGYTDNAQGEIYATNVAYDATKNSVYVRGFARGKIAYSNAQGNQILDMNSATEWGEFMAEFDEQGLLLKVQYGVLGSITTWAKPSVTDQNKNKYETGTYSGTKAFSGTTDLISGGSSDVFVSKYGFIQGSKSESVVPFDISVAKLAMVNNKTTFDLGAVAVGNTLLSPINQAEGLGNEGSIKTVITKVELSNPTEFKLLTDLVGLELPPNSAKELLEINCSPTATGVRCSDVTIYGECSDPVKFRVCVNGLPPCTNEFLKDAAFEKTIINVTNTKTFNNAFVNLTNGLRSMKVYLSGDGAADFKLVDGNGVPAVANEIFLSLKANEALNVKVNYLPTKEGISCAKINYETLNFVCDIPFTTLCGEAIAPMDASIENKTWECQRPNDTLTKTVVFTNTGNLPVIIRNIVIDRTEFTIVGNTTNIPVGVGATHNIQVLFKPTNAATYSAIITATVGDVNGATSDIQRTASLTGVGCEPKIELTKERECFPTVIIGQKDSETNAVTVTNTGNFTLNVTNVSVAPNTEFVITNATSFTLEPNGTHQIDLEFTPNGSGRRTAMLTVTSDAPETSKQIEVCGTGIPAGNAIDFGDVFYCDSKSLNRVFPSAQPVTSAMKITPSITGTDQLSFSITPPIQDLPAGTTPQEWTITCTPKRGGAILNAELTFNIENVGDTKFQLIGNPVTSQVSLIMDPKDIEQMPIGLPQKFTINVNTDRSLDGLSMNTFTVELKYNPTMMYYKEGSFTALTTASEVTWALPQESESGVLSVTATTTKFPSPGEKGLFSVELNAILGDSLAGSVESKIIFPPQFANCLVLGANTSVTFENEKPCFSLGREVELGKQISAPIISPNPSAIKANIDFVVGIESNTMLYLVNQMGEKILTVLDEKLQKGAYSSTIDLSTIPSGVYHLVYKCGPYTFTQNMNIAK